MTKSLTDEEFISEWEEATYEWYRFVGREPPICEKVGDRLVVAGVSDGGCPEIDTYDLEECREAWAFAKRCYSDMVYDSPLVYIREEFDILFPS